MKVKDITLASVLVSALIAQNYLLYSFPITLTYLFLYLIFKNINNHTINIFSILVFVLVKNIIYMALPTTILFDIIGFIIIYLVCLIPNKLTKYILITVAILIHILLLDLSQAILTGNIIAGMITNITSGFITYIYAPLSIVLIIIFDEIEVISINEQDN